MAIVSPDTDGYARSSMLPSSTALADRLDNRDQVVDVEPMPGFTGGCMSEHEYRDLMSVYPTGIAVVTTVDGRGAPQGMTCSSLASVTLRPPTLLVCLRIHSATLDAVGARNAFAINLLHARARATAVLFSSPVPDRFARVRWSATASGLPWLVGDAFALAECAVVRTVEVGDHAVVFGEVRQVIKDTDVPLLYGLRTYSAWDAPVCSAHTPAMPPGADRGAAE